jgi:ankyrin repeat domain-containing protein 50
VRLQLEALEQCTSVYDAEKTLNEFPPGIKTVYENTWRRILNQAPKHADLAKLVLLWVIHAKDGRMPVETLRRAVATCPDTHEYDQKRLVPESLILSVCCGLVEVSMDEGTDEGTRLVRLIRKFCTLEEPQTTTGSLISA